MEYTLLGSVVTMGCIATRLIFGGKLQDWMTGFHADLEQNVHGPQASEMTDVVSAGSMGSNASGETSTAGSADDISLQPFLESGNYGKMVQTSGANGTTSYLASQIETTAKQLVAEGKLTQAQADTLLKLSNVGHEMAKIQGMIEQAALAAGSNTKAFNDTRIAYNGQTYSPNELSWLISSSLDHRTVANNNYAPDQLMDYAGRQKDNGMVLSSFMGLYSQAQKEGSLADPSVKSLIGTLSSEMIYLSVATESASSLDGLSSPAQIQVQIASDASRYGHGTGSIGQDASGICTTSGKQDNGKKCQ